MPDAFAGWMGRATTWCVWKLARLAARLPKGVLVRLLDAAEYAAAAATKGKADVAPLRELRDLLRHHPRGAEAVRRIVLDSRGDQFRSFVRGALRHHALPAAPPMRAAAVAVFPKKERPMPARIAFVGDHFEFPFLREAYAARSDCRLVDSTEEFDGVEIALERPADVELAQQALARGATVSLHASAAASAAVIESLLARAREAGAPCRVFYSLLYFAPALRMKELLSSGEIGEPATIRVRAVLGGAGAALTLAPPFGGKPLLHPAFDHFLLLTFLGGPAAALAAYVQPMDRGGQAMAAVHFAAAGRCGLLECAYAPQMHIRSAFYPHDLQAEAAGTDGIIWLRRGMAETTQEPPLTVRTGRSAYTIGIESGMTADWAEVYRAAAAEFVGAIGGRLVQRVTDAELVSAFRLREKVYEAATAPGVIELSAKFEKSPER